MKIKVTPSASRRLIEAAEKERMFLRLEVKSGGCAGMTYDARLDDIFTENDVAYDHPPLRIVLHRRLLPLASGLVINYCNHPGDCEFILHNYTVRGTCLYGSSFEAETLEFADPDVPVGEACAQPLTCPICGAGPSRPTAS